MVTHIIVKLITEDRPNGDTYINAVSARVHLTPDGRIHMADAVSQSEKMVLADTKEAHSAIDIVRAEQKHAMIEALEGSFESTAPNGRQRIDIRKIPNSQI